MNIRLIIFCLFFSTLIFWIPSHAQDREMCPIESEKMHKPVFGLVNMTGEDVARLNVVNVSRRPVEVKLFICDSMNYILNKSTEVVQPGESASLEYDAAINGVGNEVLNSQSSMPIRAMISAKMTLTVTLVSSLEIVDKATSRTKLYINPLPRIFH